MTNIAASVRTRLLNKAKVEQQDFSLVLTRYGQIETMENFHKNLGRRPDSATQ